MIQISITPEELGEARFCIKRYSELYPNYPNEYMENLRTGIVEKLTAAYKAYQDRFPEIDEMSPLDIDTLKDKKCHMCEHWVKVGGHGSTDYGSCAIDCSNSFDETPACPRFHEAE